jgi:hypothetical protein
MPDKPPYPRTVLTFAPTGNGAHAAIAAEAAAGTAKAAPPVHAPAAAPVAADAEPIDAKLCARLAVLIDKAGGIDAAAKAAGVERHALRVWLAGLYAPPLLEMARLAGAAGMSLHWLATGIIADGAAPPQAMQEPPQAMPELDLAAAIKSFALRRDPLSMGDGPVITVSRGTVTISGAARIVIGGQP